MTERLKLYQRVAQELEAAIRKGVYQPGARLPAERVLAEDFKVSRPTIREAVIAMEIRKIVEVVHGSGVFVVERLPEDGAGGELNVGAFELIEARIMFEGEAAGLAASVITPEALATLADLLARMESLSPGSDEELGLDRRFHLAIAEATQNTLVAQSVEHMWDLRENSELCRHMFEQARQVGIVPRPEEHRQIYEAIARRDPQAAREAMRAHLVRVSEDLLQVTELEMIEQARRAIKEQRQRIGGRHAIRPATA
ncbi:FadR family transcriptional regulator [Novosphingobium profundi]|uniref:FadR/GntR family transcriptional regulator n=1 Tax=Novosphingobium profundi TaxID=1774954 RepID=UPI001BDAB74C|nr:FadR/GntR family transcriptional regulator [Novosphingobium profundi]MBT0669220.1 FadR family transcriptional regulator [Novosphingobium profundi]